MENWKKNFGFGCMRLPIKGNEVDYAEFYKRRTRSGKSGM